MIIPYGHEQTTVRRLPWVTFTIMALCLIAFVFTYALPSDRSDEVAAERLNEVFQYLAEHPYLELGDKFEELLLEKLSEEDYELLMIQLAAVKEFTRETMPSQRQIDAEQRELDDLVDRVFRAIEELKDSPFYRWGVVPADMNLLSLIGYQFLHGGWLHLIGNMFFLFVMAPFVEDVWGRPVFTAFYLLAGVISALMFAVHYPSLDSPLIGASGSIAGVMGGFLIRHWTTKVRFMVWIIILWGPFKAPAWVVFPGWFLWQLLMAQAWDVIAPGSGGGGVAFWAHVWGFVFGLAVAGGIKYYRIEERFLHEAIESKITLHDNIAVERAMEASSQGRPDEAIRRLHDELKAHPANIDAAVALWNLALPRGEAAGGAPHLVRAIRHTLRSDEPTLVLNHWHELLHEVPDLEIDLSLAARVGEILHEHGRREELETTLQLAQDGVRPDTSPGLLLRIARLGAAANAPSASAFIGAALQHPETTPEARGELEGLAEAQPPPAPDGGAGGIDIEPEGDVPVDEMSEIAHTLQVMEVVPRELAEDALTIEVDGNTRRVALKQVQAVGVAGVQSDNQRPFLVVDLLLDPPWSDRAELRVLRLLSTTFDPRTVVGGPDAMQAFRYFLDQVLTVSDAVPLPDPDAARGNPFRTFGSLEAYQHEILGVE
jgi:membrane associated rhomboid family serine protease